MQGLADLLTSERGQAFLGERGVFTDITDFKAALNLPCQFNLGKSLNFSGAKLICSGQQVYVDYHWSVVAKVTTLHQFEQEDYLAPFFIWHDTDRSGSDPLITKFEWPLNNKSYPLKIAPPNQGEVESRFVLLDQNLILRVLETLKNYLYQSHVSDKKEVSRRFEALKEVILENSTASLSDFNYAVTKFLFKNQLGSNLTSIMLSAVLENNILTEAINQTLNNLTGFIQVYNAAIADLVEKGIDPQVRPLAEDYLPLHYSCESDGRRLRLLHQIVQAEHYAVAKCKCNREYRFYLGQKRLSLRELAETKRWSPDVTLPVFLNQQVSGFIMGKSSALYGLVMKEVISKVLDQTPVPFLVPEALKASSIGSLEFDSLIYAYLMGKTDGKN